MRFFDACIIKEINRLKRRRYSDAIRIIKLKRALRICDEGKKGMKKGQHVMARDPDYLASLKGGIKGGAYLGAGAGLLHSSLKSAVDYTQNADNTLKPGEKNNLKSYFNRNGGHNKKLLAKNVKRLATGTGKGALVGAALGVPLGLYLGHKRSKNNQ